MEAIPETPINLSLRTRGCVGELQPSPPTLRQASCVDVRSRDAMVYSPVQAERVRGMLGKRPGITEKEMFGGIAFLLGGNMCVGVHGEDLIVRVEPEETAALLREPGAKPFDLSGSRTPSGWLMVTPAGYRTDAALRTWVARGVAFASSLPKKVEKKPKSSRRR